MAHYLFPSFASALFNLDFPSLDISLGVTLSIWYEPVASGVKHCLSLGDTAAVTAITLGIDTSNATLSSRDGATIESAMATSSIGPSAWHHLAGVLTWTGTTNDYRKVYVNGGDYTDTDTEEVAISAAELTEINIQRTIESSGYVYGAALGRFEQVAVWNADLTADEIASLYGGGVGCDPRLVRPGSLVFFAPLPIRTDVDLDYVGQADLSRLGTVFSSYPGPRVLMSSGISLLHQTGPEPEPVPAILRVEGTREDTLEAIGEDLAIEIGRNRQGKITRVGTSEASVAIESTILAPGLLFVRNFSETATDYVDIGFSTGVYPCRLYGGESALIPVAISSTALYFKANATISIEYELTERYGVT